MSEMKAERVRRPWWLAALLSGAGIGIGAVVALGLAGTQVRGETKVATASVSTLPPGSISLDDRLKNIEQALKMLGEDMIEVKARLPKKP